jgi:hypothetical protein
MSVIDIETGYEFQTKPYKHQVDAWRISKDLEAYALFMDMGCVDGDATLVMNSGGNARQFTIAELHAFSVRRDYGRSQFLKRFLSAPPMRTRSYMDGVMRLNNIVAVLDKGIRQTVEITLRSGKSLAVTEDHELLVPAGDWIPCGALQIGDALMSTGQRRRTPTPLLYEGVCVLCGGSHNVARSFRSRFVGQCRSCIMTRQYGSGGARTLDKDGYVRLNGLLGHPRANSAGQVYEHLLVYEQILGRPVDVSEIVHHKNQVRSDNRLDNLELLPSQGTHNDVHGHYKNRCPSVFSPQADPIVTMRNGGARRVFDIVMDSPYQSFEANGIVVHNCGKSKVAIDTAAYLYETGKIRGFVLIAPKGVYRTLSDAQIPEHMPSRIPYKIGIWDAAGTAEDRRSLAPFEAYTGRREELLILMMNVEAFSSKKAPIFAWRFMKACPSLIVIDESTTIKHHDSQRTKHILTLTPFAKYRRIMSGEPAANSPMNLFAQFEALKHGILGCESFYAFRATYAHLTKQRIGKACGICKRCIATKGKECQHNRSFLEIAGYKNLDDLKARMSPHAFIIKKEDCLDLPPKVYMRREVTMGKQQTAAYNAMTREAVVFIEHVLRYGTRPEKAPPVFDVDFEEMQGDTVVEQVPEVKLSKMMTAQTVLTQILRLHQICCGFMTHDMTDDYDGPRIITFDEKNPRMEALLDLVSETSGKVVIWANYRHNIREIAAALKDLYGPESVGLYFGGTKMDERRRVLVEFQDPRSPMKYFVGSPDAAGRGLTLIEAGLEVFYSNNYDAEKRNQAEDRLHRIGQTKSVTIVDLVVPNTVEIEILDALKEKKSLSQLITASNWKDIVMATNSLLRAA